MAYQKQMVVFSSDNEENVRLNTYINELIKDGEDGIDRSQKLFIKSFIESSLPYLASNNMQSIYMLIELALITYRKTKLSSNGINITSNDARNLQHLSVVQEKISKQLGLDAKSLNENKRNTLGDDILSIIKNSKFFDKKNKIGTIDAALALMVPVQNSKQIPDESHIDMFDKMPDEKLTEFLRTASRK